MKSALKKLFFALLCIPFVYIAIMSGYHAVVHELYAPKPALYCLMDTENNFLHLIYHKGNRAAVYRGELLQLKGEYALQEIAFTKWDWYFPGVYVIPSTSGGGLFWPFRIRFCDSLCVPSTMEWQTRDVRVVGDFESYYSDKGESGRTNFFLYKDRASIGGSDNLYDIMPIDRSAKIVGILIEMVETGKIGAN